MLVKLSLEPTNWGVHETPSQETTFTLCHEVSSESLFPIGLIAVRKDSIQGHGLGCPNNLAGRGHAQCAMLQHDINSKSMTLKDGGW